MGIKRGALLYEGKAKEVYATDNPDLYWVKFKNSATAFNALKKAEFEGKGRLNNCISARLFEVLRDSGVENHYVSMLSDTEMLVRRLEIIKVEVIVRNLVAGSMARRLGLVEGQVLASPVVEFCYKNDELGDPLINVDHALALGLASRDELMQITEQALRVNKILNSYMSGLGLTLVDIKLEFGRSGDGVLLGDEISPDTCRFWDKASGQRLDKDRFRRDMGDVMEAYAEVWRRVSRSRETNDKDTVIETGR